MRSLLCLSTLSTKLYGSSLILSSLCVQGLQQISWPTTSYFPRQQRRQHVVQSNYHHHNHRVQNNIDRTFTTRGGNNNNMSSSKNNNNNNSESDSTSSSSLANLKFVDVGANLLDDRFIHGIYHEKKRHDSDFDLVIERAIKMGVKHIILTAGTIQESAHAIQCVRQLRQKQHNIHFSCTVGVHPTRCYQEFVKNDHSNNDDDDDDDDDIITDDEIKLKQLQQIIQDGISDNCVVAIGEFGLDYDRLQFTSKDIQQKYFIRQIQAIASSDNNNNNNNNAKKKLPLFLHNRNVGTDLYDILKEYQDCWKNPDNENSGDDGGNGVVHSFDDTYELAMKFITDLNLYIGLNGCSLRTKENLQVVEKLPLDKIVLETDCPYCEIKRTHAGYHHVKTTFPTKQEKKFERGVMVKGRCEPCQIIQVAEVIAGVKNLPLQQVIDQCYQNSLKLYGWED